jgi:pyruvate/2-oxoacid:ferredoxin oxidoreductase alpha subunit
LYPFPKSNLQQLAKRALVFVVVELSMGQMVDDVRLSINGARPVEFLGRCGGNVPTTEDVLAFVRAQAQRYLPAVEPEEERMANV